MTDHIIDLSEGAARVKVNLGRLVVERDGGEWSAPLEEVAVLSVAHPAVALTQAVLAGLARTGGTYLACDERRQPVGLMLPLQGHHLQAERFRRQAEAPLPTRKRLWQQVVRAKIRGQGAVLARVRGDDAGLAALAGRVRSGDTANVEAQAARRYWSALFGSGFRRDADAGEGVNVLLNFGYGVLRAMTGRAACAAGLHPALGIHHGNRYDPFPLASDLMEPFRPLVDEAVARFTGRAGAEAPLDKASKAAILAALTGRCDLDGESRTLFDVLAHAAASLDAVFAGEGKDLALPQL